MVCKYNQGKCVKGNGPLTNKDGIYCKQEEPCGSLISKNYQNSLRSRMRGSENNLYNIPNNSNYNKTRRSRKRKSSTRRRR